MKYKQATAVISLFAVTTLVASAAPILDIRTIAGKAAADVSKVLGKPTGQEKTKYGPKSIYKDGKIEVVFINGKADWITVSGMSNVPFDANAIEALGLPPETPDLRNAIVVAWEPHSLYYSVLIFSDTKGKVFYAYIRVATK